MSLFRLKLDVVYYQVLTLVACFFMLIFSAIMKGTNPHYIDLIRVKYALTVCGVFIVMLSFILKNVKTYFVYWYYAYGGILILFGLYNVYINKFQISEIFSIFLGFVLFILVSEHDKLMFIYSAIFVAFTTFFLLMTTDLSMSYKEFVFLSVLFLALITNILASIRIRSLDTYKFIAEHDTLTGVFNRNYLNHSVQEFIKNKRAFSVLFMDLNNFKEINDTFGHDVGDQVLQVFSERIKMCIGDGILARWGGDEFSIVLPDILSSQECELIVNSILAKFNFPMDVNGLRLVVCTSIGCSMYPKHGSDMLAIFKKADMAMYRAKSHGNNCFYMFQD